MNTTRKAFDAWAQGCGWDISKIGSGEGWDGTYTNTAVRFMWEAWQAACTAEREACAATCEDRAEKFESAAQRADARGKHDDAALCRATAWQMEICAKRIRARGEKT